MSDETRAEIIRMEMMHDPNVDGVGSAEQVEDEREQDSRCTRVKPHSTTNAGIEQTLCDRLYVAPGECALLDRALAKIDEDVIHRDRVIDELKGALQKIGGTGWLEGYQLGERHAGEIMQEIAQDVLKRIEFLRKDEQQ